jgi:hypothetical protein
VLPAPSNDPEIVEQNIQFLRSFDMDSITTDKQDDIIFNAWLEKKLTKDHIVATSGFVHVLGIIMRYERNGNFVLVTLPDFIRKADVFF